MPSNRIVPFPGSYDEREERTVMVPLARLVLRATAGPLRAQTFAFDGTNPFVIGRGQGSAVTIPSQAVSRVHARIEYTNGLYWIIPEKTLNGTRVNGKLVQEPTQLADRDKIAIDESAFVVSCNLDGHELDFEDLAPAPAPAAAPPAQRVSFTAMTAPAQRYSGQLQGPPDPRSSGPIEAPSYPSSPGFAPQHVQAPVHPSYPQMGYDGYPPAYAPQPPPTAKPKIALWSLAVIGALALIVGVVVATVKLMGPPTVIAAAPTPVTPVTPVTPATPVTPPAPAPLVAQPQPAPVPAPVPVVVTPPPRSRPEPATLVIETTKVLASMRGTVVDVARVGTSQGIGHIRLYSQAFDAAQTKLTNLQKKYGKSEDYADFIAEAKQDYLTAARRREVRPIEAAAGTVTKVAIKPGDELRLKQVIGEIATAHVIASEIDGDGTACVVQIGTKKLKGSLIATATKDARTIALDQVPKDVAAGELDAKIHCE